MLTALTATALTGPGVDPVSRGLAGLLLGIFALRHRALWGLVLGGILLGSGAGVRQALPRAPAISDPSEVVAAWVVDRRWSPRSVRAWVRAEGAMAVPVQLSGLPEGLEAGARGFARVGFALPRRARNPDDRDGRRSARARAVAARAWVIGDPLVLDAGRVEADARLREGIARRWHRQLPPATHALWRALLLADRDELDPAASRRLRRLGLAHLLALSGLHVGVVAGLLLLPLRRWGRRALVAVLPALMLWAAVAGAGPSLVRAVALLGWMAVARWAGRPADPLRGLAVVATSDLCLRPDVLLGVGWWLSYAATAAILRLLPHIARWPRLGAGLAVSLAAQAATAPWILGVFGQLAPAAAGILLVLGPLFALLLAMGVVVLGLELCLPMPAACGRLLGVGGHVFGAAVALLEKLSPAPWGHPGITGVPWALGLLALGLVLPPWRSWGRRRWLTATALVLGAHLSLLRAPVVRWTTLDVGQGDAGVLRAGRDAVVVDAGPRTPNWDSGERVVLPYLQRRNLRGVGLALTHGHLDHVGGADALLAEGRVRRLYLALCDSSSAWVQPLRQWVRRGDTELVWLAAGDRVRHGALVLRCLWPPAELGLDDANDRSLVLRFEWGGEALLLTGDLERSAEARLLERPAFGPIAVLKVAHHGGDTGTDGPWLDRLRPRWALLSCGVGNRYGHPDPSLVRRLAARDIGIVRTDRQGAIEVRWTSDEGASPRLWTVGSGFLDDPQGRSYPPAVR